MSTSLKKKTPNESTLFKVKHQASAKIAQEEPFKNYIGLGQIFWSTTLSSYNFSFLGLGRSTTFKIFKQPSLFLCVCA